MPAIDFTVYGQQITQGSKRAMPIYAKGGVPVQDKRGNTLTRVVNDNPKLDHWRQEVAYAAAKQYDSELIRGPVRLTIDFYFPRPKSHFGTGRNAGKLKPSAPPAHIQKPDTLKLARAIEDALTGVVWHDDSQVVYHNLHKYWSDRNVTRVVIQTVE